MEAGSGKGKRPQELGGSRPLNLQSLEAGTNQLPGYDPTNSQSIIHSVGRGAKHTCNTSHTSTTAERKGERDPQHRHSRLKCIHQRTSHTTSNQADVITLLQIVVMLTWSHIHTWKSVLHCLRLIQLVLDSYWNSGRGLETLVFCVHPVVITCRWHWLDWRRVFAWCRHVLNSADRILSLWMEEMKEAVPLISFCLCDIILLLLLRAQRTSLWSKRDIIKAILGAASATFFFFYYLLLFPLPAIGPRIQTIPKYVFNSRNNLNHGSFDPHHSQRNLSHLLFWFGINWKVQRLGQTMVGVEVTEVT